MISPVYAITDRERSGISSAAEIARVFLDAGIRTVQLREKSLPDGRLLGEVTAAAGLAREAGTRLIVNDRVDLAKIAGCGVHLGEDDMTSSAARTILGEGATIGVSTHDLDAARRAFASAEVDYVAFGPVFASAVKAARPAAGLEALARVAREKTKPLVAIGGISLEALDEVWSAGADSAAMISALNGPDAAVRAERAVAIARRRFLPRKIWLVGFMGSGKTTIGRILAARLDRPFFDLDAEIERTSGKTVRAIFESEGEPEFRRRESVFVEGSLAIPAGVFATGGGTFAAEGNRSRILKDGLTVFLDPPFEALAARAPAKGDRPLFDDAAQARRLLEERLPFYRMARLSLSLSGAETPEDVADEVLRKLEEQSCVI